MASVTSSRTQGFAGLYESGELTDFTIECGKHSMRVHKVVLGAQSEHFRVLCGQKFKEGHEGKVVLKSTEDEDADDSCDDPEAIKLMVERIPTAFNTSRTPPGSGTSKQFKVVKAKANAKAKFTKFSKIRARPKTVPTTFGPPLPSDGNMVVHARVFAVATKYGIPALQTLACSKFTAAVAVNWDHPLFAEAAHIVYNTTVDSVRQLRDIVCETIRDHKNLLDVPAIESVIKSNTDLHHELLRLAYELPAVAKEGRGEDITEDEDMEDRELLSMVGGVSDSDSNSDNDSDSDSDSN
ncbi:hypothetical protein LTR56_000760 [Elasticomyces elasticus]|nr:hypothetical protein LTR22_009084 [Elasticomyces elasticus]KAK3660384.1 hypothetical protein LTR56_000760 [Elasticomyces elasticus]KAK4929225.1 hypothetical protein LTR49_004122 [Elasticomyces elasticus]KAK5765781.1 hypothetical protein LTS12_004041 [Elasticomyces elasticus]